MNQPIYDRIGIQYATKRQTDPRLAKQIHAKLVNAKNIVNIGAGTGSYEPADAELIAVEPSLKMISQRSAAAHPVVQASAEALPFTDRQFTHALTVLSMHHWKNRGQAFAEINRVATEGFVAVSWDPAADPFWLTRDYFPEIHAKDQKNFPGKEELSEFFDDVVFTPLPVPEDCIDGFMAAYWKRPEAYLNQEVRQSISSFATWEVVPEGMKRLQQDLETGAWIERNGPLMELSELDVGYVLITGKIKK